MTCNNIIRNFRKRNFLWDKDVVECMIRSRGLVWHLTKSFQKGERLNQKFKMKMCKLGDVCKQTSLLKRITDGGLGPKPQLLCNFLEKKLFICHWITFGMCLEPFERIRFLTFESQLKKIKLFQSSFHFNLVENMFMILHLGLNFESILVINNNSLEDFP